ncbi:unnamed protein product [Protopolystoma xenopodis]|uniref:Uncharacterized protein n=1 Tax=Protopolystoma xenopodis TaxID=117903 RepID=A0A3S5CN11_9PLAT|nr:unnamed protein product [Protopolystoma xenopodis]
MRIVDSLYIFSGFPHPQHWPLIRVSGLETTCERDQRLCFKVQSTVDFQLMMIFSDMPKSSFLILPVLGYHRAAISHSTKTQRPET